MESESPLTVESEALKFKGGGGYLQPRVLLDLFPSFRLDSTLESEKKKTSLSTFQIRAAWDDSQPAR